MVFSFASSHPLGELQCLHQLHARATGQPAGYRGCGPLGGMSRDTSQLEQQVALAFCGHLRTENLGESREPFHSRSFHVIEGSIALVTSLAAEAASPPGAC